MADDDHPVTLGEVYRHLQSVSAELHKINNKLEGATTWRDIQRVEDGLKAQHASDVTALTQRIQTLEDWQKWAIRIVLALVITAVIGGALMLAK